eukprot:m.177847 g.177847  ORF g.177847 m.177847 type:complete len:1028 (+) comp14637_c0_seq2:88-3171(+)
MAMEATSDPEYTLASQTEIDELLSSPLLIWARGVPGIATGCDSIDELCQGVFLNEVFSSIINTTSPTIANVMEDVEENIDGRLHNFHLLVNALTNYFQEERQVVLLMELPVVDAICRTPLPMSGLNSLRTCLTLLLLASVTQQQNQVAIAYIMSCEAETQRELMAAVKTGQEAVFVLNEESVSSLGIDDLRLNCLEALEHLTDAVAARDSYAVQLDRALYKLQMAAAPKSGSKVNAIALQARIDCMADDINHLETTNQEQQEEIFSLREQLRQAQSEVTQSRATVEEAVVLRDELDVWRNRALEAEKAKAAQARLEEKLEDFEYVSKQAQQFEEQVTVLQQQLSQVQLEAANTAELEAKQSRINILQAQVDQLTTVQDRYLTQSREQGVIILRLEEQNSSFQSEIRSLKAKLEAVESATALAESEALDISTHSVAEYAAENAKLQAQVTELTAFSVDSATLTAKLQQSQQEVLTLQSQVSLKESDISGLNRTIAELEEELSQKKKEISSLKSNLKGQRDAMSAVTSESQRTKHLEDQLEVALSKSLELKDERIAVLERRLQDSNAEKEQLRSNVKSLTETVSAQQQREATASPLPVRKTGTLTLTSVSSPLVRRAMSKTAGQETPGGQTSVAVQLEMEALRTENAELQKKVKVIATERSERVDGLKAKVHKLEKLNDTITQKAKRDAKRISHYKKAEQERIAEIEMLETELDATRSENKELLHRVQDLLVENQGLLTKTLTSTSAMQEKEALFNEEKARLQQQMEELQVKHQKKRGWFGRKKKSKGDNTPGPSTTSTPIQSPAPSTTGTSPTESSSSAAPPLLKAGSTGSITSLEGPKGHMARIMWESQTPQSPSRPRTPSGLQRAVTAQTGTAMPTRMRAQTMDSAASRLQENALGVLLNSARLQPKTATSGRPLSPASHRKRVNGASRRKSHLYTSSRRRKEPSSALAAPPVNPHSRSRTLSESFPNDRPSSKSSSRSKTTSKARLSSKSTPSSGSSVSQSQGSTTDYRKQHSVSFAPELEDSEI